MEIRVTKKPVAELDTQLIVAGVFEGSDFLPSVVQLDKELSGQISRAFKREDFSGKKGQKFLLYGVGESTINRVCIIGLGKAEDSTPESIRRAFGSAGKVARGESHTKAALVLDFLENENKDSFTRAAIEGFALATYRFASKRGRDLDSHPDFETVEVLGASDDVVNDAVASIEGTMFARDLTNMPAMDLYPESYAAMAKELESKHIKVKILDVNKLKKLGMGALVGVGQGSNRPPVLIHLSYDPGIKDAKTYAIVGKGITFDAGGLDLKTAAGMRDMKVDMAGSAAVMGIFKALEKWQPKCKVEGFIPAAENLTSGWAYKPGDVLKSYKGITIEIDNTDAEGRLALADALHYAIQETKPDAITDLATLTGACVIALGHHATGMFGTGDELKKIISDAGEETGERVWDFPLWPEYSEQLKSEIADLKNTGGRPGGSITAAAFLREFVDDTPWIHLDIAGTANEVSLSYVPHKELGTGVGVRLMLEVLRRWA